MAELYRCDPPPGGGVGGIEFLESSILAFCAYFWAKMPFFGKKKPQNFSAEKWPENGPQVVKNGQNCPKIDEINRMGPPENPNESQKYRKNGQKRSHSAV